jgi:hypothetical protein
MQASAFELFLRCLWRNYEERRLLARLLDQMVKA